MMPEVIFLIVVYTLRLDAAVVDARFDWMPLLVSLSADCCESYLLFVQAEIIVPI